MAFLCISLNGSRVDTIHLIDGDLIEIDKYTTKYDTAKALLKEYPEKIDELNNIYNLDGEKHDVKVRIFLSNDKEQFVMYRKHLIAFKLLIKNRKFLRYVVSYDNNIFSKKEREIIDDEEIDNTEAFRMIKSIIEDMNEDEYYDLVRRICDHYDNYLEDYQDEKNLTIEDIYRKYLVHLKEGKLSKTGEIFKLKNKPQLVSPFAVFEHPNFFKTYGSVIKKDKPIFILGGKMTEHTRFEYKELYENCKKCFHNPIYYPFNANVSSSITEEFASVYDNSLLVIVNGNAYNSNLEEKIYYACSKGITVLIFVKDLEHKQLFSDKFSNYDTVIIKTYIYNDYDSQKSFADLAAGLHINEYKKHKSKMVEV